MKIVYIAHARFPTEKAYGHQIAQVCAALAELGREVELLCPDIPTALPGKPTEIYRIRTDFKVTKLPAFNALWSSFIPGFLAVHVTWFSYRRSLKRWFAAHSYDLAYARTTAVIAPALRASIPTALELHTVPRWSQYNFVSLVQRCCLVVALTTPMKNALVRRGIPPTKITVEPDGVDLAAFQALPTIAAAKIHWKLPTDRPVVAYIGSLKSGHDLPKGVEELIAAAGILHRQNTPSLLWIVGGPVAELTRLRSLAAKHGLTEEEIRFEGPVPSADVPRAMAAANLCVYPAPASTDPFFTRDTSPLKLLEYMAAGVPTVTADLPPIHDLLNDSNTRFCKPGDSDDLARAIGEALADPEGSAQRAVAARTAVEHFTWQARLERIIRLCSASKPPASKAA